MIFRCFQLSHKKDYFAGACDVKGVVAGKPKGIFSMSLIDLIKDFKSSNLFYKFRALKPKPGFGGPLIELYPA
jgi:hypothetical protein